MTLIDELTGPTTELLQELIRNACVNDGTPDSGEEVRNADLLQTYLEGAGLDVAALRQPTRAARRSSPASRAATPTAPALCLMGHTDVVPVNPDGWSDDPFGGELDRRRGVGPRRHRHAQHHVVDGRRLPPAGRPRASARRAR